MNHPFLIRAAIAADKDLNAVCHLMQRLAEEESGQSQLTVKKLRQQLLRKEPELMILVAEWEGEIVATALAYMGYDVLSASSGLHLSDIYVLPEQRGKGIGTALLAELASYALSKNGEWISWTVLSDNNKAKFFYKKVGATAIEVDFMAMGVTVLKQLCKKNPC